MSIASLTTGVVTAYLTKNATEIATLQTLVHDVASALRDISGKGEPPQDVVPPRTTTDANGEA